MIHSSTLNNAANNGKTMAFAMMVSILFKGLITQVIAPLVVHQHPGVAAGWIIFGVSVIVWSLFLIGHYTVVGFMERRYVQASDIELSERGDQVEVV